MVLVGAEWPSSSSSFLREAAESIALPIIMLSVKDTMVGGAVGMVEVSKL